MVVPKPNPTKDALLKLMSEKDKVEAKIRENGAILAANDNVGMRGPLVTADGYPRNDIDIYNVRQARQQIICFQNDHKELMKQIEQYLIQLHAEEAKEQQQQGQSRKMAGLNINEDIEISNTQSESPVAAPVIIVKVNLVSPGSPAEEAGLCVGDEIIEFGTINSKNFNNNLHQIGELVRHMQNQRVTLKVQRAQNLLDMILIPKPWAGRGLLGCNIILPDCVER